MVERSMGEIAGLDVESEAMHVMARDENVAYKSQEFELVRPGSNDDGNPAAFVYQVFDESGHTEGEVSTEGESYSLNVERAKRIQVKVLIARTGGTIKDLWIQRVERLKSGLKIKDAIHLSGEDASRLAGFFRTLEGLSVEGQRRRIISDEVFQEALADLERVKKNGLPLEVMKEILESDVNASDIVAITKRKKVVEEFGRLLEDGDYFRCVQASGGPERVWQDLFEDNPWLLGAGLSGQLLIGWDGKKLEQVVSGASVAAAGKRVDAMMRTVGAISSMVFVEIKHADTPLLKERSYRSGIWAPSDEVIGGVSQIQGTVHAAIDTLKDTYIPRDSDGAENSEDMAYLFNPRSFLVVGSLNSLLGESGEPNRDKIRSFELFRSSITLPHILTFDEVYQRAKWVVENLVD